MFERFRNNQEPVKVTRGADPEMGPDAMGVTFSEPQESKSIFPAGVAMPKDKRIQDEFDKFRASLEARRR